MAKTKLAPADAREKKLRRQLQQAEEAKIEAQQDLEAAQSRLVKATERLEKRGVELLVAQELLKAFAASTNPTLTPPTTTRSVEKSTAIAATEADGVAEVTSRSGGSIRAERPRRARRQLAPEGTVSTNGDAAEALGIVVP